MKIKIIFILSLLIIIPLDVEAVVVGVNDLVKCPEYSSVYRIEADGKRHPFPLEAIYFSWYNNFSLVKTIPLTQLQTYPLGRNVPFRKGSLFKIPTVPKVYEVVDNNGTVEWIKTEEDFYARGYSFSMVKDLPESFWMDYSEGIVAGVEYNSDYKPYCIEGHCFTTDLERRNFVYNWNKPVLSELNMIIYLAGLVKDYMHSMIGVFDDTADDLKSEIPNIYEAVNAWDNTYTNNYNHTLNLYNGLLDISELLESSKFSELITPETRDNLATINNLLYKYASDAHENFQDTAFAIKAYYDATSYKNYSYKVDNIMDDVETKWAIEDIADSLNNISWNLQAIRLGY